MSQPDGTRTLRVITVAGGLLLVLIAAHMALWWFFQAFYPFAPGESTPTEPTKPLAGPRLQTDPVQDLEQWKADQEARLHRYGWIDREAKLVRIPIERAMELLVERASAVAPPAEAKHE